MRSRLKPAAGARRVTAAALTPDAPPPSARDLRPPSPGGLLSCEVEEHLLERRAVELPQHLARGAVRDNAAVVQEEDAVAQPLDLLHVVRRVEDRHPPLGANR